MPPSERKAAEGRIADRLIESSLFRDAHCIYIYVSFRDEADTRRIIGEALRQRKARGRSAGARKAHDGILLRPQYGGSAPRCIRHPPSPGPGVRKRPIRVRMSWWLCRGPRSTVPVQGSDTAADSMTLIWRKTPDVRVRRWPFPARLRMNCPRMPTTFVSRYIFTEKEMITCF